MYKTTTTKRKEITDVLKQHPNLDLELIHHFDNYNDYDDYTFNTRNHLSEEDFKIIKEFYNEEISIYNNN